MGSLARGDARDDSDADLLFRFAKGRAVGFELTRIEERFAELLGRPVDLISERGLNRRWLDHLAQHLEVLYDEAA